MHILKKLITNIFVAIGHLRHKYAAMFVGMWFMPKSLDLHA